MPNNNSNHKNDMDDFFAQFDSPSPGGGSGQGSSDYTGSSYASGTRAMRSSKTRNSSSHRRSSQKHREQSAAQNGAAAGGSAHAQRHHSSEADHRSVKEKDIRSSRNPENYQSAVREAKALSNRQTEQRQ